MSVVTGTHLKHFALSRFSFKSGGHQLRHPPPLDVSATQLMLGTVLLSNLYLQAISKDTLRPLMSVLLCCLVDEMVGVLPEGMAMLKALNLLMMKILENSDR